MHNIIIQAIQSQTGLCFACLPAKIVIGSCVCLCGKICRLFCYSDAQDIYRYMCVAEYITVMSRPRIKRCIEFHSTVYTMLFWHCSLCVLVWSFSLIRSACAVWIRYKCPPQTVQIWTREAHGSPRVISREVRSHYRTDWDSVWNAQVPQDPSRSEWNAITYRRASTSQHRRQAQRHTLHCCSCWPQGCHAGLLQTECNT